MDGAASAPPELLTIMRNFHYAAAWLHTVLSDRTN